MHEPPVYTDRYTCYKNYKLWFIWSMKVIFISDNSILLHFIRRNELHNTAAYMSNTNPFREQLVIESRTTCTHTHTRTHTHARTHTHTHTRAHTHTHTHTHTHAHTHTQTRTHTRTHTRIRRHAHTHARTHTRTHTHTHTHTHECVSLTFGSQLNTFSLISQRFHAF